MGSRVGRGDGVSRARSCDCVCVRCGWSHQVEEAADHLSLLQVGLSVQRGGLDVTQAVGVARAEQEHVGGQDLVAAQPDEVSNPDLLPEPLQVAPLRSVRGGGPQLWFHFWFHFLLLML